MKLQDLYKQLKAHMSESDARYMLHKRINFSHTDIISAPDAEIDPACVYKDLDRYKDGEPLSRIYGEREFWGLDFEISPATLDPRADTETLIEKALQRLKTNPPRTILDLGTGSGCILLSLLHEFPNATGTGVDLSLEACQTAKKNAKSLGLESRATFICGSWAEALNTKFDLVVSNPPYIDPEAILKLDENVQKHDPILALDGGKNGLDPYKIIFSQLSGVLKPGGFAFFEIGFDQEESVMRLGKESRFSNIRSYADSAGLPRVVEIFLSE